MRALALKRRPAPGSLADTIQMLEISDPPLRRGEVVVQVLASTINIDDIHAAEGTFYGGIPIGRRPSDANPLVPGSDLAGVVLRAGPGVRSVRAGDAVFGVKLPFGARGAWEEVCAVRETWVAAKPQSLSFGTAAACGVSGLVALSALEALQLRRGMRVVMVGATGGIGGMAVQFAVRAGAEVIGICSEAHAEEARRLGCARVIDYHREPWDRELIAETSARIDRVLDLVGGQDVEEAGRRVLDRDGIFVTVVGPQRFIGDRALGWSGVLRVLGRIGYRIVASRMRGPRYVLTGPGLGAGKMLGEVARAAAGGVLPPIDSVVPFELEPMRQALRRAAAHQNNGRIVMQMDKAA